MYELVYSYICKKLVIRSRSYYEEKREKNEEKKDREKTQ